MITLHIPVDDDGLITFNATLFAIVRVTLKIDIPYNNDNNNNGNNKYFCYWVLVGVGCNTGLRSKLQSVFPNCPKKMLDTVLPERPGKLSLFPSLPSSLPPLTLFFISCFILAVHTTSEEYAALFIQQFWRRWKLQVERQCETRPHHQRMSNVSIRQYQIMRVWEWNLLQVLRRIPDMGPGLLQRRLTTITNMVCTLYVMCCYIILVWYAMLTMLHICVY